uniref:Major facilitator superfamily (MFS) profile domain-containing protein n=1 Tax=Meloidogyne floridensis TaxID=298350 RepID=A0A915P999_9BILA
MFVPQQKQFFPENSPAIVVQKRRPTSSSSSSSPIALRANPKGVMQQCICERLSCLVVCRRCGHDLIGRVLRQEKFPKKNFYKKTFIFFSPCSIHPRRIALMDLRECPNCRSSGTQKLSGSTSGNAWASQTDKNENIKIELNDLNKNLNEENDRIDSFVDAQKGLNQLAILANLGFLIVFGIRCNFGAAKNHMSRDFYDPWGKKHKHSFNWTSAELGVMESSFFYGYLITQIPAGFLVKPPNSLQISKMFGLAIGGASFLNLLLPYSFHSHSDFMVAIVQISQGLVQGLAYPAMHGVWRYWAPPLERSKLATTAFTGSYAGAVFGLPISAWLVSYTHWSAPFYIYGIAGVLWSIFWFSLTFERPAFHPTISAKEKEHIETSIGQVSQTQPTLTTIPWRAILTSRSGFIAALPHAVMGCVVLLGGRMADYLRFGCEALFLLVVAYTKSERTAMTALIFAVGCSGFAISGFNVNHLDIAPPGLICPFVVESLTAKGSNPNGWTTVFLLASMIHFTGITFYGVYASGELQEWAEPKEEEEKVVWGAEQASEARRFEEGGKRKGSYGAVGTSINIEPLPKIRNYSLGQTGGIQIDSTNPFGADWGDSHNYYQQNGGGNFNEKRDSLR